MFFDTTRPLFLRLHIQVDGKPFEDVWHEFVAELVRQIDSNGDGALSRLETQAALKAGQFPRSSDIAKLLQSGDLWNADLSPVDGKITPQELARLLRSRGNGPFQAPPNLDSGRIERRPPMPSAVTGSAGALLFQLLDRNDDTRLSKSELEQTDAPLRKFDLDDDGTIGTDELRATQSQFRGEGLAYSGSQATPIFTLSKDGSTTEIIRRLLDVYGQTNPGSRRKMLVRENLGLKPSVFEKFDSDSDGRFDPDELREFLRQPTPRLELSIWIGKKPSSEHGVSLHSSETSEGVTVRRSADGRLSIVLGSIQIEVISDPSAGGNADVKTAFVRQFKSLDADGNNYLDKKEAQRNQFFRDTFFEFDSDGDGKLFEEELVTLIDAKAALARSRTRMDVKNLGNDLFVILDANRDRRLGKRELKAAAGRIPLWDADGDGKVSKDEIPQQYQIILGRGRLTFPGLSASGRLSVPGQSNSTNNRIWKGPRWFQKMDRNNDGDVSPREFLGTRQGFKKLDRDGDGLIDAQEAEQAE